jgi:hypothetical protein
VRKIQAWKRGYIEKAGSSQVAQRQAKISVNSYMRRARCLFSEKITRHLAFQITNPFVGVEFEPKQSRRYRSSFAVTNLIETAKEELTEENPELYKIFLLGVMSGLRRAEIDALPWSAFLWDQNIIRIEATEFFRPKSEDSRGNVQVDPELMETFRATGHGRAVSL